jgi:hypothetical protein
MRFYLLILPALAAINVHAYCKVRAVPDINFPVRD